MGKFRWFGMQCCCPTGDTVEGCTCCAANASREYSVTVSSFTGPFAVLNGTYVLTYGGRSPIFEYCFWRYTFETPIEIQVDEFTTTFVDAIDLVIGVLPFGCFASLNFTLEGSTQFNALGKLCPCESNPAWDEECFSTVETCPPTFACLEVLSMCCTTRIIYGSDFVSDPQIYTFTPVEP